MIKLYLCGPMSGLPEYNYPAFQSAASQLRMAGYDVFNPTENGLPADAPWTQHMRADIINLMTCQAVALLPNTEKSRGAQLELHNALELGMPVASVTTWLGFIEPVVAIKDSLMQAVEVLLSAHEACSKPAQPEPPHV